jgi:hypothetical protein
MAEVERHLRPTLARAVITSVLSLGMIAACVLWVRKRARVPGTATGATSQPEEPTQAA